MRIWVPVVLAVVVAGMTSASAAEVEKQRVAELSKPASDEIVFTAGGDAIWNRKMSATDAARAQGLLSVFKSSDVAFVNFEQVMADSGYPAPKPIALAAPSIVDEFANAGINLVSFANNHAMDFGISGMETTHRMLEGRGITHAGAGANLADALKTGLMEKKGLKIAFLAFMVTPNFPQLATPATERSPGVAPIHGAKIRLPDGKVVYAPWDEDLKRMEQAIAAARKLANYVVVSFHIHWGGPGEEVDATGKQLIAHTAIKAGADLILGHGPQVINGIELYEGKPIFYSLGNFTWQFDSARYDLFPDVQKGLKNVLDPKHFQGLAMRMTLTQSGKVKRIELLPIQMNDVGNPYLALGKEGEPMLNDVVSRSAPLNTTIEKRSWYAVVNVPQ